MSEELTITNEDIELLKEMKNNCLKADVYYDEKRLLKANAITKFLLLQQENQLLKRNCNIGYEDLNFYRKEYKKLKSILDEIREYINNTEYYTSAIKYLKDSTIGEDLLQILDKVKE